MPAYATQQEAIDLIVSVVATQLPISTVLVCLYFLKWHVDTSFAIVRSDMQAY